MRVIKRFGEHLTGWLFIAPALLGFTLFYLLPTIRAFFIGLTEWNLLTPAKQVGVSNYRELVQDEQFWGALKTTSLYVAYNIPLQTMFALLLAVLLNNCGRSVFYRSAILAPFLVSNVIAAMVWFWMLDPHLGIVNRTLESIGFGRISYFSDQNLALPVVAAINIWRHVGFNALIFYAGLQSIPRHLYESVYLEGASRWRAFVSITLPLLRPVTVFVVVTSVIGSFQVFDTVAVTTQGGPGTSTETIMWYIYKTAFGHLRMGYASAMSCMLFFGLICVTLVQLKTMRANESDLG